MSLKLTRNVLGVLLLTLLSQKAIAVEYVFISATDPFQALTNGISPRGTNRNIMSAARRETPSSVIVGVVPADESRMVQNFPPHANGGRLTTVRANFSRTLSRASEAYSFAFNERLRSLSSLNEQAASVAHMLTIQNIRTPGAQQFTQHMLGVTDLSPALLTFQLLLREMLDLEEAYRRALARPYATYMYSHINQESVLEVSQWVWDRSANAWRRDSSYEVPAGVVTQHAVAASLNPVAHQPNMGSIAFNVSLPQIPDLGDFLDDLNQQQQPLFTTCTLPSTSSSRRVRSLTDLFTCESYTQSYYEEYLTHNVIAVNAIFFN
ncbi:hypothetical protein [Enterovibrio coralii]|uniref:Uncharacterized protein n=1 Tax=Enterovibrio coralii TaxID=294935 RepID=A0A135I5L8_9GAMM|nr:hypothetical protein [Enterovibrio coralii]KXF80684.1 hypothetical protein ATN88_08600 [Enterovibrio coralii]